MANDYYATLGVSKDATKEEIQRAYKKLAKKFHPDLNKSAEATDKFKEINEAASVLTNEKKRSQYDHFGSAGAQGFGGGSAGFDFNDFSHFGGFEDILNNVFGGFGFGRQETSKPGRDMQYELAITLEEASQGIKKTINIPRLEKCASCNGSGAEKEAFNSCTPCKGSGKIEQVRRTPFGLLRNAMLCPSCHGYGKIPKQPCAFCSSTGRVKTKNDIIVTIPEGIEDGMSLRLSGEGEAGERNASSGNLFVVVSVNPHKLFEREGSELYLTLDLPFVIAALGGEISVPTLYDDVVMKIPEGTQNNTHFRLKNQGMPYLQSKKKGMLHVTVSIKVPQKLSKEQKKLLTDFSALEKNDFLSKLNKKLRRK